MFGLLARLIASFLSSWLLMISGSSFAESGNGGGGEGGLWSEELPGRAEDALAPWTNR